MVGRNGNLGSTTEGTSVMPMAGCSTITRPPHCRQNWRWLASVFLKVPSSPRTSFTFALGQSVAPWTGALSQVRHDSQWQNAITAGAPVTSISVDLQMHAPRWLGGFAMAFLLLVRRSGERSLASQTLAPAEG